MKYNITTAELIREGIKNILENKKNDVYFRLIANKIECDEEESSEIISKINNLSKDDLIVTREEELEI